MLDFLFWFEIEDVWSNGNFAWALPLELCFPISPIGTQVHINTIEWLDHVKSQKHPKSIILITLRPRLTLAQS